MLKKLLPVLALVFWPSYSSSESITPYYGYTPNAAASGLTWGMGSVLPTPPGLDINGVIYSYTPQKLTEDDMKVHIQNQNAFNPSQYIFRETDDWSGKPGDQEIRKVIPFAGIHRSHWGDGSIEVEGTGTVEDANVVYMYKVTPCYDPQFDPNCPGYEVDIPDVEVPDYEIYDAASSGDADQAQWDPNDELYDEEDELTEEEKAELEAEEERDREDRLEKALAAADNSALFAEGLARSRILDALNKATNINSYYANSIPGGSYSDTIQLVDKKLPENKRGLRNGLAQQLLHNEMVEQQYRR